MTGYTETIRRWATDHRRTGRLQNADGTGEVGLNAADAGKRLAVRFTLRVEQNQVAEIRYQVFGCGYTMAACAVAAKLNEERPLEAAGSSPSVISRALGGLPAERGYCAELASRALGAALVSARSHGLPVQSDLETFLEGEADSPVSPDDPFYVSLMRTPQPRHTTDLDRRLFAGVLAVASQESADLEDVLGLTDHDVRAILMTFFPAIDIELSLWSLPSRPQPAPEINPDVRSILLSHVPTGIGAVSRQTAEWLAHILAARAARPGHLWVSMGCFERSELTAAIRRHLPSLANANHQNMRWKRFLFRQACELRGGTLCKSPNCGDCSDYALCFSDE